ncbi:MAG: glucose 1-dehydrogenase [Chloroflexi bacterium]|nr:glucose 1-dehydrogenase [Chloroflexota bacterium]
MGRLENKVAVITGGARGIGKQIALTFAREGADIVIGDIGEMETAAGEIRKLGRKAVAVKTDVTKKGEVENLIKAAIDNFKKIDILVNDAGTTRRVSLAEMAESDWDLVLSVNLKGVFLCMQAAARYMKQQKSGKIINISSTSVFSSTSIAAPAYQASKAGVAQLTRACAREFGPYGINVNAIAPGLTATDLSLVQSTPEKVARNLEDARKLTPLGRVGTTQDIANLALFFASEESSFISGQLIAVDGGRG